MTYQEYLQNAVTILRSGGVVLCPTDTIAGLSCDATNAAAIERIFRIKERPAEKSLIILVSGVTMLEGYVQNIPDGAYQLLEVTEEPLTIVYPAGRNLPASVMATDGSVAIRVVKTGFIADLVQRFRKPVVSTSANISGQDAPKAVSQADPLILPQVDLVVDLGESGTNKASGIIKFDRNGSFRIIRK